MTPYHFKSESRLSRDDQISYQRQTAIWAKESLAQLLLNQAKDPKSITPSFFEELKERYSNVTFLPPKLKGKPGSVGTRFSVESRAKLRAVRAKRSKGQYAGTVWPKGHRSNPGQK